MSSSGPQGVHAPYVFEAPYAGHTFLMDSSVAPWWWMNADRSVSYDRDDPIAVGLNKVGEKDRARVWRITIVDDYSRVVWARYTLGNDQRCWIEALEHAITGGGMMSGMGDGAWPAFGVPESLYTDQDSVTKTAEFSNLLHELGIQLKRARPSTAAFTNAQAKGKVEPASWAIQEEFEGLYTPIRFHSLEQMNETLTLFLLRLNHGKRKDLGWMSPFEVWLRTAKVRQAPRGVAAAPRVLAED